MALFEVGGVFPPSLKDIERLALYQKMEAFFEGNQQEIYDRMSELLKDSPYKSQIEKLYLNCNLSDIIASKPSELLLSQEPVFESGLPADSEEQKALNRLVEDNDIKQTIFNFTIGAAIRGDAFLKDYFSYRNDYSELLELGLPIPKDAKREVVIQTVHPSYVFPELARGSMNQFKAVNIAYVEWLNISDDTYSLTRPENSGYFINENAIPFLVVERHLAGYVLYERYKLSQEYVSTEFGAAVPVYRIDEKIATGRESDIIATGTPVPLVFHFAYKQTDIEWRGVGAIEKIAQKLVAVADRLTAIDWILHKHSDPILTGPELDGMGDLVKLSGAYIARNSEDADVKYVTFDGKLDHCFKELDLLYGEIFAMAQLPAFLFGSSMTAAQERGGGTSHTDGSTTKLRYAPVTALLDRLNNSLTRCLGDALYYAQILENFANKDEFGEPMEGFVPYEPQYPTIHLSNGIPSNEKEETDIIVSRYGAGLIDKLSAIKLLDRKDDHYAKEMVDRIKAEEPAVVAPSSTKSTAVTE